MLLANAENHIAKLKIRMCH